MSQESSNTMEKLLEVLQTQSQLLAEQLNKKDEQIAHLEKQLTTKDVQLDEKDKYITCLSEIVSRSYDLLKSKSLAYENEEGTSVFERLESLVTRLETAESSQQHNKDTTKKKLIVTNPKSSKSLFSDAERSKFIMELDKKFAASHGNIIEDSNSKSNTWNFSKKSSTTEYRPPSPPPTSSFLEEEEKEKEKEEEIKDDKEEQKNEEQNEISLEERANMLASINFPSIRVMVNNRDLKGLKKLIEVWKAGRALNFDTKFDVNERGPHGETPLMVACGFSEKMSLAIAKQLIVLNADVMATDSSGWTALHHACKQTKVNAALIQLLFTSGADPSIANADGTLPLHYLVRCRPVPSIAADMDNFKQAMEILLAHGHVDEPNMYGETSLMISVSHCNIVVFELLLQRNPDISLKNKFIIFNYNF